MFFYAIHNLLGKHFQKAVTQFVIGCIAYVLFTLLIVKTVGTSFLEEYTYLIMIIIILDSMYIAYIINTEHSMNNKRKHIYHKVSMEKTLNNKSNEIFSNKSIHNQTLTSEINDFKITHEASSENNSSSIFALTEKIENNSTTKT